MMRSLYSKIKWNSVRAIETGTSAGEGEVPGDVPGEKAGYGCSCVESMWSSEFGSKLSVP